MFPKDKIKVMIQGICDKSLQSKSFEQVMQLQLFNQIAQEVIDQLKQYSNYKWIVHVNIQQLATMLMTSQSIWDSDKDGLVEYVYKTSEYVLGIVVYGCYFK
eukprot:NODE_225_length_13912_cov_0.499674.p7 type:complete len:102 gc:universal NODE_225_length_13912_cov_0.499674:12162-11857(-)